MKDAGNAPGSVTLQDPAGKIWRREFDGLGRLVKVVEEVGGANDETSYGYDAADRLTTVTQGVQTRSFVYNWAGQLLSATNPESGITSYQYDAEGNFADSPPNRSPFSSLVDRDSPA